MILTRRRVLSCLGAAAGGLVVPRGAQATTVAALTLPQLVQRSARVSLVTPVEYYCEWATFMGQRRIVTWTRVLSSSTWAGGADDPDEVMVLTLGGRVGKIAEKVHGEAALRMDQPSLLFLADERGGARRVVAMAQGHYPTEERGGELHLRRSGQLGHLIPRRQPGYSAPGARRAVDELDGRTLASARKLIGEL